MLTKFIKSRRQGISERTIEFYKHCLQPFVDGYELTPDSINLFLSNLTCGNAKHSYYRALRAFCNWTTREGYVKDNPINRIDPPNTNEPILPSLTSKQVQYLINTAGTLRDKCIIALFADSGMRLSELASIKTSDIDWKDYTVTIWGKGDKQRRAPFTKSTARLLKRVINQNGEGSNIWHIEPHGIQLMLQKLRKRTGLPCNPHTFRRSFACNLHRKGLSTLDIMHLGGWSDLSMVLRYTRSITFDDCLEHYREVERH